MNQHIQLNLSSEELLALLHVVSLGKTVAEAHQDPASEEAVDSMVAVSDRVFELGLAHGYDRIASFDPGAGKFCLTDEFLINSIHPACISSFEEEIFWEQLAGALTERDLERSSTPLEGDAYHEKADVLEDYYMDVFSQSGVDHLHLIPPQPHQ